MKDKVKNYEQKLMFLLPLMLFLGIHLAIYQNSINYMTEGIANKSMVMGMLVVAFYWYNDSSVMSGEIETDWQEESTYNSIGDNYRWNINDNSF